MRYSELAEIYEKLEKEPGKLKKAEIISVLLKEAPAELLPKIILLLQGRVFPFWDERQIGVASQMMIKALAKATGFSEDKIKQKFAKAGDLGIVAEEFVADKKQTSFTKKLLTVEEVFSHLQKIAEQMGAGSQERKLNLIVEMLSQVKPKEARYLVRSALEQLRVGVAEGIVRDAIASAFKIDVDILESAWFVLPDYGEVAEIAKEKGEVGLKRIKPKLGVPLMVQLAEKSPSLEEAMKSFENPELEIKYDGARLVIHKDGNKIKLFTRRLEDVTNAFPDVVELCRKNIHAERAILDSETIAVDSKTGKPQPFQKLSQRIKRKYDIEKTIKEIPTQVNLFDIISLDGKAFFETPLSERRRILQKIVREVKGKFQLAEALEPKDLKEAEKFYKFALEMGEEGVIVKNLEANYTPGRRVAGGWLKVKPTMENLDLAIIGATWGTGKRTGWLGSLILGVRDPESGKFLECGMLGTGIKEKKNATDDLTLEELTKILKPHILEQKGSDVKIKPKIIIEVGYEEIQKSQNYASGWALRFPRFIRLREDKGPEEADTIERLRALAQIQKGRGPKETGEK
ncbi:MAG TPA: ATP-dependent DNA ligase [archaeon]|nr:ATP-dependent DNA ligase [archaeon]